MSEIPSECRYLKSHEWVRMEADGICTVGITDHAQSQLGDIVFVELPQEATEMSAGEECGVIESVKAASDFYSPLSGEIVAANEGLTDAPELVNQDPYGDGWLFKIKIENEEALQDLLDAEAYQSFLDEEE